MSYNDGVVRARDRPESNASQCRLLFYEVLNAGPPAGLVKKETPAGQLRVKLEPKKEEAASASHQPAKEEAQSCVPRLQACEKFVDLDAVGDVAPGSCAQPLKTKLLEASVGDVVADIEGTLPDAGLQQVSLEHLEHMPLGRGQDLLERDARHLLELFEGGGVGGCRQFLSELPSFQPQGCAVPVDAAASGWYAELADLCEDNVNGATAMQVQPFLGDTGLYPLLVLLQASSWATDMPLVFYVDMVHALVGSVLHKELFVHLNGRWKTKNRYWTAATADIGQGKSPAMEPVLDAMKRVLRRHPSFAVGFANDGFHYQKASATASAVLKLRQCSGYLTLCSDESGMCLSPALAAGGVTDAAKHVDLPLFLNAAHGGDFSWSNRPDREKALKAASAPPHPAEPVPDLPAMELPLTNVHFVLIGQLDVFSKFWAQVAHTKQIGLAQRFLLSFGVRQCTAKRQWNSFFRRCSHSSSRAPLHNRLVAFGAARSVASRELSADGVARSGR